MTIHARVVTAFVAGCSLFAAAPTAAAGTPPQYEYREAMVPMRDGVQLQTVILTPAGAHAPLPILLTRTPYGVPDRAPPAVPQRLRALAADGYIFVAQNIRGRFKSEGTFTLADDSRVDPGKGTIETRDAWDTIDWLIKNLPNNNGRVGIVGVSYAGYTAAATLLDPHPALKAVSEQASPVDQWMNDDDHRFGALRLSYTFEYAVMEESDKNANTHFKFDGWDTYQWYLNIGPLANVNARYVHDKVPFWNDTVLHPNYDAFWKSQAWAQSIHSATVPTLNVAGFWDQEDPWGPWQIFRRALQNDPGHTALMVAGPWCHGCWNNDAYSTLGPIQLNTDTAADFHDIIEAPFFAYWLHDKGVKPDWRARIFETGSNQWKTYAEWPPRAAKPTALYLHTDGTLDFKAPTAQAKGAHRSYFSDPANPVPYRPRPISPTYPGGDWRSWEWGDQRFVDHRPDVLSFVSAPLEQNLTIAGEVVAEIFASTTGTDSDYVVKLIDVFPEDVETPLWTTDGGPDPGAYGKTMNGYQLPIAMEVRRARFLTSYERPKALTPNVAVHVTVPLRDRDHVFLKGHRVMVQIQSSWFPLIDRNPQNFTASIYSAAASDFVAATERIYTSPEHPSRVVLPVLASAD